MWKHAQSGWLTLLQSLAAGLFCGAGARAIAPLLGPALGVDFNASKGVAAALPFAARGGAGMYYDAGGCAARAWQNSIGPKTILSSMC